MSENITIALKSRTRPKTQSSQRLYHGRPGWSRIEIAIAIVGIVIVIVIVKEYI